MTVKSKKRRLKRARAHQVQSKGKDQFFTAFERAGMREKEDAALAGTVWKNGVVINSLPFTATLDGEPVVIAQQTPARAKCPACDTSQKVRKDGTLGKHSPTRTDTSECIGSGKPWNADV